MSSQPDERSQQHAGGWHPSTRQDVGGLVKWPRGVGRRRPKLSKSEVSQRALSKPGRGRRIHSKDQSDTALRCTAPDAPAIAPDLDPARLLGRTLLPKGAAVLTQPLSTEKVNKAEAEEPEVPSQGKRQRQRSRRSSKGQPLRKCVRTEARRQAREVGAAQELGSVLR